MFTTIIIIAMVLAVLLMLVVLIQNPKGGGLSSEFGSSSSQMFGVKKTGDLLEQLTWGFSSAIMILALVSRFMLDGGNSSEGFKSVNADKAQTKSVLNAPAPKTAPAATSAPAPTTAPIAPAAAPVGKEKK